MFKPEYIMDNINTFGVYDTVTIITDKLVRSGFSRNTARNMSRKLVLTTWNKCN
jgi:hypothetical protein